VIEDGSETTEFAEAGKLGRLHLADKNGREPAVPRAKGNVPRVPSFLQYPIPLDEMSIDNFWPKRDAGSMARQAPIHSSSTIIYN
jgi:hypothetical protein